MSLWIRYDASRGIWEVAPDEVSHIFSDLVENHPRECAFGKWVDFNGFADARAIKYQDDEIQGRRVKLYGEEGLVKEIARRRKGGTFDWGPGEVDTPPSVSPSGKARVYFDKTTNKLRVSENAGAFENLVKADPTIPHAMFTNTTGGGSAASYTIPWDTESFNSDSSLFTRQSSNTEIKVSTTGKYLVSWHADATGSANQSLAWYFYVNTTRESQFVACGGDVGFVGGCGTMLLPLSANNYVKLTVIIGTHSVSGTDNRISIVKVA
jgi:hypothetical protein